MISAFLDARHDARASFYGKARIDDDGVAIRLYSYNTHVATFHKATREVALMPAWDYSATTVRHVREFLLQTVGGAGTKAEIRARFA